ncbi:2-aminoethylphosphonate ABC transporter substrate-binding protein [Krasilnikovia sp. MM14-A1259]|uniref:2-aminoethylphosphonate ABC transporter substrate-binding protein n=1 Tax=Krasilnikovia sp. MM14-A1259 TaxID=3373539 RepID=UPI0038198B8C
MKRRPVAGLFAATLAVASLTACGGTDSGTSTGANSSGAVTVYSADGLADWYKPQFDTFTKDTGIKVDYVEAGSSEVVSRIEKERSNPQADVLITLPPFIQQADRDGMLGDLGIDTAAIAAADKAANGHWTAVVDNYSCFIVNNKQKNPPKTWDDLLAPTYRGKLQYSTPGQAGDGTAVLILLQHLMGKDGALAYLKRLEVNNVGPSSSTGKLQPKVSSGELIVANGDLQMNLASITNDKSNFTVFFPALAGKAPQTLALPYDMGLTSHAPHADNGRKLMEFLLSPDAQKAASALAFGIPVRGDIAPTEDHYAAVRKIVEGVEIYHPDWNTVLADLDADIAAYNAAVAG